MMRKLMPRSVIRRTALLNALCVLTVLPVGGALRADEAPANAPTAGLQELTLQPSAFTLLGERSEQQLLVTGRFAENELRDLTAAAQYSSADPAIARIEGSVVHPVADGTTTVIAQVGEMTTSVPVTVSGMEQPDPVSFKNETLAALTKASCNMGACHGSPSGKGGFRLSLRGYDPPLDILTLRTEYFGRRTNVLNPADSLILKKALMEVAHGGGRRLHKGGPAYSVLHGWIEEGMQVDDEQVPNLLKVEVIPSQRVLRDASSRQQLIVNGHFSDGSIRDLTPLTVFSSSNESVATVDENGLVEKVGRGETAILVRYLDKMATSYVTFLEEVPGFVWNDPEPRNFVDRRVFDKLQTLQILPSELCTDEEFLRRAYLDAIGRLPTIEETVAFLEDASPTKRDELVDRLVDSPDFASFWTLHWADILRSNSKNLNDVGVHKFQRWIYDSVLNDKPLDEFAQELLTADGSVFENPAANYWRASRDPQDATETTAQLFLGIRIQCAKCHNHPFERWTQDNYYGIAAAFTRVGRKKGPVADEEIIYNTGSGEIQQPRTGETMKVHLLLEGDVDVPQDRDRRDVFAEWLTSPDNPFFARACVNRIWGYLLGRGIVEPVDDFRDSNPPSNAELLDELAQHFVENGYSRKWAVKTIMKSRTYQLSSRKNDFNAEDEIYNSHARTRLLSAEQLLDALCQTTGVAENFSGLPAGMRAVELPDPPTNHYFLKVFGQPQREMACQCERTSESNLSQALQMINGPVVHNKLRDDNGRIAQMLKAEKSNEEIITTLYLAALSRKPDPAEMQAATRHVDGSDDRRQALEDVGWAIVNSKEFLFQH